MYYKKERTKVYKPFIIIRKFPRSMNCNKDCCSYTYMDSIGNKYDFCEDVNVYKIGDTIK